MTKVIIVDDEKAARDRLKKLLSSYPSFNVISEASDGAMALEQIEELSPDIVFLDIEMPELNGIEVASTLGVKGPLIVFVTAYDEYALQAFESSAIDYIVKPINKKRLDFTIEKISNSLDGPKNKNLEELLLQINNVNKPTKLAVKIGSKYEILNLHEISVIRAKDHYSEIILGERELLVDDPLDVLLKRLENTGFLRVHRNAIVNIDFISELKREGDRKFVAILSDKKASEVPISREKLPGVKIFMGIT